jgi:uncharacterized membrane protein
MINITLYHREDCHLCDEVEVFLNSIQEVFPHRLTKVDINQNPDLDRRFGQEIPVLRIGEKTYKAPINQKEILLEIKRISENQAMKENVVKTGSIENQWTGGDRISLWLSRHYIALVNLVLLLFIGFPFLAPVLMKAGLEVPAMVIYKFYGTTCHQLSYRSIFLFGDQLIYPRMAAKPPGIDSFSEATKLGEGSSAEEIWAARDFIGNETIGYKVAICQRDIAIYLGILAFNFLFIITKRKLKPLPWFLWIIIGILPVGVDGLSQLLSQPPLSFFPYRESTLFWRLLTGFLFGFTTAWFGIPHLASSMEETREFEEVKLARVRPKV